MEWEACSTHGGEERCIQSFGGETCVKEKLRYSWGNNFRMDLKKM
jgi:hypothetical protein